MTKIVLTAILTGAACYWLGFLHGWVRSGRRFQRSQVEARDV